MLLRNHFCELNALFQIPQNTRLESYTIPTEIVKESIELQSLFYDNLAVKLPEMEKAVDMLCLCIDSLSISPRTSSHPT